MTIELRHIEHNARLSEETPCFSGDLFWKGQKVATVANHGHGGPDMVRVIDKAGFDEAVAFVKALPKVPSGYADLPELDMDLELWCHIEVGKIEDQKVMLKEMRKTLRSQIATVKDGKVQTYRVKGVKVMTPELVERFKRERPQEVVLNSMPEAEAFAIYAPIVFRP